MLNLSYDIIFLCSNFLTTKDCINLILTCKYLNNYGNIYGYIKDLYITYNTNMSIFLSLFCKHYKSINYININTQYNDTYIWIPFYPKKLVILGNNITPEYFIVNKTCNNITYFKFHDYNATNSFQTDWSYFENLESLFLNVKSVNIENIKKYCKKLKILKITYPNVKINSYS
jgi:hypothetical protein